MNTRTFLSRFPTFMKRWKDYRKKLGGTPLGWTVMSDYCLDDPNKNDCITVTISPILGQPEQVARILDKKLPHDIKQMKHVPEEVINFIRDRKEFFSIVFILLDKQKSVNIQHFKDRIAALSESPMLPEGSRKRFKIFSQFLKKGIQTTKYCRTFV